MPLVTNILYPRVDVEVGGDEGGVGRLLRLATCCRPWRKVNSEAEMMTDSYIDRKKGVKVKCSGSTSPGGDLRNVLLLLTNYLWY